MGVTIFFVLIYFVRAVYSSSVCSKPAAAKSCDDFTCSTDGGYPNEGIQLLIPSWNFSCQGTIEKWFAHLNGNTSFANHSIEFQIFKPDSVDGDVYSRNYSLVHGNEFHPEDFGNSVQGSLITRSVSLVNPQYIPVRPGYIVGVYLPPNTAHIVELMYEDDGDTDVYYWTGIQNRVCQYSLCSGRVKKNINLLVGWDFTDTTLGQLETSLAVVKEQHPLYCQGSIQECDAVNLTTSSAVAEHSYPSTSSLAGANYSSSISSSFSSSYGVSSSPSSPKSGTSNQASTSTASSMSMSSFTTNKQSPVPSLTSPSSSGVENDAAAFVLGVSDFQLALLGAVVMLLLLVITLLIVLMILFAKRRRNTFRESKAFSQVGQRRHVPTAVNPSYKVITVTDGKENDVNSSFGKQETAGSGCLKLHDGKYFNDKIRSHSEIYTELDEFQETSRKDYAVVEVEDYCVPCTSKNSTMTGAANDHVYESMYNDNKAWTESSSNKAAEGCHYHNNRLKKHLKT